MSQNSLSLIMLVGLIVIMYLLLIRPQRKREKQINSMRNNIQVGDQVITIGGMIAKVVKTTEDTLTLQLGDKTKVEIMRWGISKDITAEDMPPRADKEFTDEEPEEPEKKPQRPKRIKKADAAEEAAEAEAPKEEKPAKAKKTSKAKEPEEKKEEKAEEE